MRRKYGKVQAFRPARDPVAVGILLAENPNRVKRGAARLDYMDGFVAELEAAQSAAYSPLTVMTPVRDSLGRRAPRSRPTSYTV
jgi:hypothetical protein